MPLAHFPSSPLDGPFADNALDTKAPLSRLEDVVICMALVTFLGGAQTWIALGLFLAAFGSWLACFIYVLATVALAYHPIPDSNWLSRSKLSLTLYRYFSYRFVWRGDVQDQVTPLLLADSSLLPFLF
jgi:2-acylglycerol O-acyltransferase 2